MKKLLNILLPGMFVAVIFLGSCEKVVYPPIEIPSGISYSDTIQPIWDTKCVSCHGSSLSPVLTAEESYLELINGEYIDTASPADSELMQKLYGTHDSRATEAEKQLILAWITEGAKNN